MGPILLGALAMAYAGVPRYGALDPHGQADKCQECHLDAPPEGLTPPAPGDAKRTGSTYPLKFGRERAVCERCHMDHNRQTHPVEVTPRLRIPDGWPLDANGQAMCSTCHHSHLAFAPLRAGGPGHLLRGDKTGVAFCRTCHVETARSDSRAWHRLVVETAHGGPQAAAAAPGKSGRLDPLSNRCLACHDGTMAREVTVEAGDKGRDIGLDRSHPVGVVYPAFPSPPRGAKEGAMLRDLAQVDKRIRLFDGKIGCGTCHDLYSTIPKFLAIEQRGGRLCRACHQM